MSLRAESLSFTESLAQTIGGMAPSGGLAVVIPLVFAQAGNATWLMFIPMLVGFLLLVAVFRVFASRHASAGGLGGFGELAFGRWGGILVSWTYIVTLGTSIASGAPTVVYYADVLLHQAIGSTPHLWWDLLLMALTGILATGIAYRGIKLSTDLMLVIECLSLGAMISLVLWALVHEPRWIDPSQFHLTGLHWGKYRLAFVLAFMSLSGFETVTSLGEEARQATTTIPRVIVCCITPIGLLYVAMAYCLVLLFQHSRIGLDQTDAPFAVLADSLGLPWLGAIVSFGVLLSFFAMVLGCLNACARILYDLAKKGDIWPWCGKLQPAYASPVPAILLVACLGLAVPLLMVGKGTSMVDCIAYLTQLSSCAYIASYMLVAVAAPVFLRRIGALRGSHVAVAIAALVILGVVAFFSLYPVPSWPWNVLPYAFVLTVAVGVAASAIFRIRTLSRVI